MRTHHTALPLAAIESFGARKKDIPIDEFVFYQYHTSRGIEIVAWFGDVPIALWNEKTGWVAAIYGSEKD